MHDNGHKKMGFWNANLKCQKLRHYSHLSRRSRILKIWVLSTLCLLFQRVSSWKTTTFVSKISIMVFKTLSAFP